MTGTKSERNMYSMAIEVKVLVYNHEKTIICMAFQFLFKIKFVSVTSATAVCESEKIEAVDDSYNKSIEWKHCKSHLHAIVYAVPYSTYLCSAKNIYMLQTHTLVLWLMGNIQTITKAYSSVMLLIKHQHRLELYCQCQTNYTLSYFGIIMDTHSPFCCHKTHKPSITQ